MWVAVTILEQHIAIFTGLFVAHQLIRGVHCNSILHILKHFFVIDDVAVILVVTVKLVGAADRLKQGGTGNKWMGGPYGARKLVASRLCVFAKQHMVKNSRFPIGNSGNI